MTRLSLILLAAAATTTASTAHAVRINFSSLETVLADPDDMMSLKAAMWTGWATQSFEYNMPFVEVANDANAASAVTRFTMTIGDTDYQFSNEFLRKDSTNSYPFAADGSYAIAGFSTPDVEFTSSIADAGDTLIVDFTDGGLQPGEVVRFQVDINKDPGSTGTRMFADYPSVFFGDTNSDVRVDFADPGVFAQDTLPDLAVSPAVAAQLATPRQYTDSQEIDIFPSIPLNVVPEPSAALLSVVGVGLACRRRS
ncbi:MAG: hypothetical protein AAF916_11505 [Planctomycetota bacterium]